MDLLLHSPLRTNIHLSCLDLLFSPENLVWNSKTLVIFEGFKHLEILETHGLCAQGVLHGLETHLTEPALPRASGAAPPQDVLLRGAAAQALPACHTAAKARISISQKAGRTRHQQC